MHRRVLSYSSPFLILANIACVHLMLMYAAAQQLKKVVCEQDPLLDLLTAEEQLTMYARLKVSRFRYCCSPVPCPMPAPQTHRSWRGANQVMALCQPL